jgi:hypothetical protein
VLCCAVLCCAVLCCAVLCCAVLCCAALCCAVLCCAALCCVARADGASFELAAFDMLLDDQLRPWLLEVNTSPSLKAEAAEDGGGGGGGGGDLALKLRVVGDMLELVDAMPSGPHGFGDAIAQMWATNGYGAAGARAGGEPEALLEELLAANYQPDYQPGPGEPGQDAQRRRAARARNGTSGVGGRGACVRRWRLGGCRHCPSWAQVAQLWRAAAERRRARGFHALLPSEDKEWTALARPEALLRAPRRGGLDPVRAAPEPPSDEALLGAWALTGVQGDACVRGGRARAAECMRTRWEAMLCAPGASE